MKVCRRCGSRLRTSNVTHGYKYWCPRCDEDMYEIETVEKKGETMYLSDSWSFLVELKAFPDEVPETVGIVPVDLSEEDDRGDIEPSRDVVTGELRCLVGKDDERAGDERRYIARVWGYNEDDTFNGKFSMFRPVTLADFVRCLLDANKEFDGFTEDDVARLKEVYGV